MLSDYSKLCKERVHRLDLERERGPIRGVLSAVESVASICYSYARKFLHLNEIFIFPRRRLTVGTFEPDSANRLIFCVLGDSSPPIKNS